MKTIKKSIAMLLALVMVLAIAPLTVFAQETEMLNLNTTSGSGDLLLGDINGDGKVTATDARIVLRVSTKLENLEDQKVPMFEAADVNKDGKITATDARKILRVSTKLESFENNATVIEPTTAEPETTPFGLPEEIVAFCSGNFYLEGIYKNFDNQQIKMATKDGASEFLYIMDGVEIGFYIKDKTLLLLNYSNKTYTKDSNSIEFAVGTTSIDSATVEKTTIEGKDAYIWTITSGETKLYFTVVDGSVKSMGGDDKTYSIDVTKLSADIPADLYISNSKQFEYKTALSFFASLVG